MEVLVRRLNTTTEGRGEMEGRQLLDSTVRIESRAGELEEGYNNPLLENHKRVQSPVHQEEYDCGGQGKRG